MSDLPLAFPPILRVAMPFLSIENVRRIPSTVIANVQQSSKSSHAIRDIVQRDRDRRGLSPKISGLNNEAYRNALQAFIDRRRSTNESSECVVSPNSPDKERFDLFIKTKNENENKNKKINDKERAGIPGVPHVHASDIFEIGWIAGTEDRYMELMFAEWQSTRVALRRHTHPECREAVKADLEVLTEIRHPSVLLLMATTHTDDHGLVAIFEPVDCTLYNFVHEQGERVSVQGIAKCAGNLAGALKHAHMRGYVHGAISPHCVFLATCGTVKLGGWELAHSLTGPNRSQEFEHRLRYEIFRWQAPEIFRGHEPSRATDVYGLALLMWEMCTMNIPWNGLSKSEVEAQYVQWERRVVTDLYNFPPLLNKLLEAGLQLDISKRTLDMSRMRRFLQTLEIQYENADPIYVRTSTNNNNNNSPKLQSKVIEEYHLTDSPPVQKYTVIPTPKCHKQRKVAKSRNVPRSLNLNISENDGKANPTDLLSFSQNETAPAGIIEQVLKPTMSVKRVNARNVNKASPNEKISIASKQRHSKIGEYEKTIIPEVVAAVDVISTESLDSSDDESSLSDTRESTKRLRQTLANKRNDFFYGNDCSQCLQTEDIDADDDEDNIKSRILTEVRSKDYQPHKPASHKTSLQPKEAKPTGQFNSPPPRKTNQKIQKLPYSYVPTAVRGAVSHPKVLNSNSQSFFESSLWRKEKMICISKMRKDPIDDSTFCLPRDAPSFSEATIPKAESPQSDKTYTIDDKVNSSNDTRLIVKTDSLESNSETIESKNSLQALRDSLDRATEIVLSSTTTAQEDSTSEASSPSKSPEVFDPNTSSQHEFVFENLYELKHEGSDGEIKSIERSNDGERLFFTTEKQSEEETANEEAKTHFNEKNSAVTNGVNAENTELKIRMRISPRDDVKKSSFDPARLSGVICESIAESLHENDHSSSDSKADDRTVILSRSPLNPEMVTCPKPAKIELPDDPIVTNMIDDSETSFTLMIFGGKDRECHSCNTQNNLPRRRSLPAALGQLRNLSNMSLGKLPIRKAGVTDNTVEDIYIDDEFGDSLNVNMVLLDGEVTTDDEDFLPHLELSDTPDYL
ncbi:uncharacterized protein [Venturia canescens]|uniref:uncharacterized protein isoform X2 n=1 Tax=Venturia canescens TaxID=32260 RepID=UPI001C9C63C4|nr:uncharacterized protein LOC122415088 isoform X2 [Venturia canescens]